MNENLDLTKILEECPKGTKFYSKCFGELTLDCIIDGKICLKDYSKFNRIYEKNGKYVCCDETAEIDLLPSKDQRDWSKWHIPFKDGDILSYQSDYFKNRSIYIYKYHAKMNTSYYVALSGSPNSNLMINYSKELGALNGYNDTARFATEEEKQKLFNAIKANGYKWDAETKTLKNLIVPKFKVGDIIQNVDKYRVKITKVNLEDEFYGYESLTVKGIGGIRFDEENNWKLVINKFDINILKPFDKVLVRNYEQDFWTASYFSHNNGCKFYNYTTNGLRNHCIPYNDETAHLIGTNKKAPEYYRYWED